MSPRLTPTRLLPALRRAAHLLFALGAFAVFSSAQAVRAQEATRTVTDLVGRTVKVPAKVERILLGEGRLLPALAILDREDPTARIVGMMGEFENLDPGGYAVWAQQFPRLKQIPRLGRNNTATFSDEQALSARPQLAIFGMSGGHGPSERNRETLQRLEAAGVAIVFIDFRHDPLKNTPRSMALLGDVLGKRKEADAFNAYWQAQLNRVTERLAQARPTPPTVFLENRAGLSEGCCDTMVGLVGKLLDAAGGHNIAKGLIPEDRGTLNPELLLAQQPRFYIGTGIGTPSDVRQRPLRIILGLDASEDIARASLERTLKRPTLSRLTAVREGRAHAIWHHYYNSPFSVVAVQVMAKWLHPELFSDLDPHATLQTMFDRFQPIPLTGAFWVSLK